MKNVKIEITFDRDGKRHTCKYEFDKCESQEERGIRKIFDKFGQCVRVEYTGQRRVIFKGWNCIENFEDFVPAQEAYELS